MKYYARGFAKLAIKLENNRPVKSRIGGAPTRLEHNAIVHAASMMSTGGGCSNDRSTSGRRTNEEAGSVSRDLKAR